MRSNISREQQKKSQIIADFLVKIQSFEPMEKELAVFPDEGMRWILNTYRASNREGTGIGIIIESSSGVIIKEAFRLEKQKTNIEALS